MLDNLNKEYFNLIGNKKTGIYHIDTCYCLRFIKNSNRVEIDDEHNDDEGKHYRACGKCLG